MANQNNQRSLKCIIGEGNRFAIWAVDDAWFEGSEDNAPICFEINLEEKETFDSLNKKISFRDKDNKESGKVGLIGDFKYLKLLLKMCSEKGIQLILCNFEYFEENFNKINESHNAVLLDVSYEKYNDSTISNSYGIHLIVQLLGMGKPQAEIFFVTGYPIKVKETLDYNQWDNDWRIRNFLCTSKTNPERDLQSLFKSFSKIDYTEYLETFSRSLKLSNQDSFSHPNDSKINIPSNFLLYDNFTNDEESFKSLYYYDEKTSHGKGDRNLSLSIFINHLKYACIDVVNNKSETDIVRLPIQPGILFLICFVEFIYSLNIKSITQISIQAGLDKCVIEIPLNKDKALVFKEAISTGGGQLTECFRSLIACKKDVLQKYLNYDSIIEISSKWTYPKLLSEVGSKIYKQLIEFKFDLERNILILSWKYQDKIPSRSSSPERYFEE